MYTTVALVLLIGLGVFVVIVCVVEGRKGVSPGSSRSRSSSSLSAGRGKADEGPRVIENERWAATMASLMVATLIVVVLALCANMFHLFH